MVVFEEKQVANAQINMSWSPDPINLNADGALGPTQFVNALTGSTAQVTLTDPYMTGASWAVLFDTAAAFTNQTNAAAHNILLPKCGAGQDPRKDRCFEYIDVEDPGERKGVLGQFAHLLITLYYEVAGTKFSLETYFRVQGFDIKHGGSYPSVSIRGVDPQTIAFNQTLNNFQLKENMTLEDNLKEIVKDYGHTVSFCNPPGVDYSKEYLIPRSFKERSVTAEEVIRKYVRSVKGTYSKLPIKKYANKLSICTRANVNQGCSVFYLGKGLYEGYNITGGVDPNILNQNLEVGNDGSTGVDDVRAQFNHGTYELDDISPTRRREKLKDAKLDPFPQQFTVDMKKLRGRAPALKLIDSKVDLREYSETYMFGVGVNGSTSNAILDGTIKGISRDSGSITIETNYFLRMCKKEEPKECFNKVIFQESNKINKIEEGLAYGSQVRMNQKLGTAAASEPEQVRLFLKGFSGTQVITVDPAIVKGFAVPTQALTDEERAKAGLDPKSSSGQQTSGVYVGRVGSTGNSTGPHLHVEKFPPGQRGGRGVPITDADVDAYVRIGGKPASAWPVTSGYGAPRRGGPHNGIDYGGNDNQPVTVVNGASVIKTGNEPGGYGNYVEIRTPAGYDLLLAHFRDGSLEGVRAGQTSTGTATGVSSGVQGSPTAIGAKISTEFVGVPRALRIIPGRTVLSFVTKYDEWIENGRPSTIDPGVWIPQRFSKWFVQSVRYNWTQGNLRVGIEGVTDWGVVTAKVPAPSFEDYMKSQKFEKGNDYYNYIRSLGDLCYTLEGGKNSCEEICAEAEEVRDFLRSRTGSNPSVSSFPSSDCEYVGQHLSGKKSDIQAIAGALKASGINGPVAIAGVLGNFSIESKGINANIHNEYESKTCTSRSGAREECYGVAQWGGVRKENVVKKCGNVGNLDCQLQFMVSEIKEGKDVDTAIVSEMNNAKTPEEAAMLWNKYYERGEDSRRAEEARKFFGPDGSNFKCQRSQT